MRRASISIPSNIAEGSRRSGKKEYRNFIRISYGSGAELETQSMLAKRIKLCVETEFYKMDIFLGEVMKMLNKMQSTLR